MRRTAARSLLPVLHEGPALGLRPLAQVGAGIPDLAAAPPRFWSERPLLREGPARALPAKRGVLVQKEDVANKETVKRKVLKYDQEPQDEGRADRKRRRLAPVASEIQGNSGSASRAMLALANDGMSKLMRVARARKFAKTTLAPAAARWNTCKRFAAALSLDTTPVTTELLEGVTALLIAGGYRSGDLYLSTLKRRHIMTSHAWGDLLALEAADCRRALLRGQGVAKRAPVVKLESCWADSTKYRELRLGDTQRASELDMVNVACWWMLRGLEVGSILATQVEEYDEAAVGRFGVRVKLGPTKNDIAGTSAPRGYLCLCASDLVPPIGCPACSLKRVLGASVKTTGHSAALFCDASGAALSRNAWLEILARVTGLAAVGEHTPRRMGAQLLARLHVQKDVIKFQGRWGSDAIEKYIEASYEGFAAGLGLEGPRPQAQYREGTGAKELAPGKGSLSGVTSGVGGPLRGRGDSVVSAFGGSAGSQGLADSGVLGCSLSGLIGDAAAHALETWKHETRKSSGAVASYDCRRIHVVDQASLDGVASGFKSLCGWSYSKARYYRTHLGSANCGSCLKIMNTREAGWG